MIGRVKPMPCRTVVIVGGGIAGPRGAYELSRRGISVRRARARAARRRRDPQRADRRLHHRRRPRLAARCRSRTASSCARSSASAIGWSRPSRRALAYIQRGGRLHPLPAASVLGIPDAHRPVHRARRLFSWPGKLRMGAELFVPAGATTATTNRLARSSTRRFGARSRGPTWRSRCSRASTRATSIGCRCGRCSRASSKPSGRTAACCARFRKPSSSDNRRRAERDGAFDRCPAA